MRAILIVLHCETNTGYAIESLELTFYRMALDLAGGDRARVHFAYSSMIKGRPTSLPGDFDNVLVIDTRARSRSEMLAAANYVRKHEIDVVFGFDQPVHRPMYRYLRDAGVVQFVSYWGAPISALSGPLKLALKRLECHFRRAGPCHYIFESQGMARTAIHGRGISKDRVHVAYLGVDTSRFFPNKDQQFYIHEALGVPSGRRVFFYSGHMEPRKGVSVIIEAARLLSVRRRTDDWHVVLTGNQPGQEQVYLEMLCAHKARNHVTFGGYRTDIELLHRGAYAGIIASTGWDSLTMSSLEMQASGLPLLVSNLAGLNEAIDHGRSGFHFTVGDPVELANHMEQLLDDPELQERLSRGARDRVLAGFTVESQQRRLIHLMRRILKLPCESTEVPLERVESVILGSERFPDKGAVPAAVLDKEPAL